MERSTPKEQLEREAIERGGESDDGEKWEKDVTPEKYPRYHEPRVTRQNRSASERQKDQQNSDKDTEPVKEKKKKVKVEKEASRQSNTYRQKTIGPKWSK